MYTAHKEFALASRLLPQPATVRHKRSTGVFPDELVE